jgi:sulfite reductase (NADPH) flavoprotein alpha-component
MFEAFKSIFTEEQINAARKLYNGLSVEQRMWMSGYLAGLNQSGGFLAPTPGEPANQHKDLQAQTPIDLTILYGTHTGNSKLIAEKFASIAKAQGIQISLSSLPDYQNRKLKEEKNILLIVSTHGEGEPPAAAEDFYAYIFGKKAPQLKELNFAVIGLGDSSYIHFCQTGKDIFFQLKALGALAVHDLIELDIDFNDKLDGILSQLVQQYTSINGAPGSGIKTEHKEVTPADTKLWTKAEVLDKILLNGKGSEKETYHFEFDIENTNLTYKPGDALEVIARNNETLVEAILKKLGIKESESIEINGESIAIHEALITKLEITTISPQVLKKFAEYAPNEELQRILQDASLLKDFLYGIDFLDLLNTYPVQLSAKDLSRLLRKLPARLYSISSSYDYNPDEVHITVSKVSYSLYDREHLGICSAFLADRINIGDHVLIRVKPNEGFRLPDHQAKVIMVGAGTGVAPFRSFLQQRKNDKAQGNNWLFFGDQRFATDFLYQSEMLDYRDKGILEGLDVAFSRDQAEKIYVQHRLKEKGQEIYQWLKEGAYFYLCGDKNKMAKDVKNELIGILEAYGKLSNEEAKAYFKELQLKNRFQEDIY